MMRLSDKLTAHELLDIVRELQSKDESGVSSDVAKTVEEIKQRILSIIAM